MSILMKLEVFRQICEKYSNIKFHENLSDSSRVAPQERMEGRTDEQIERRTDGQT